MGRNFHKYFSGLLYNKNDILANKSCLQLTHSALVSCRYKARTLSEFILLIKIKILGKLHKRWEIILKFQVLINSLTAFQLKLIRTHLLFTNRELTGTENRLIPLATLICRTYKVFIVKEHVYKLLVVVRAHKFCAHWSHHLSLFKRTPPAALSRVPEQLILSSKFGAAAADFISSKFVSTPLAAPSNLLTKKCRV